ncbi:DotI/IcmL family type IV secretion protein [Achromobacter insuavis]|uniref:DotI/IcmL family type IV secretion protein n=1 Tax=Achromobacter insuavis TaxID=1287735 RepID=UPI001F142543|nr:DotI/IcmL family type IV secretion protein [Achromobacter insuavis]
MHSQQADSAGAPADPLREGNDAIERKEVKQTAARLAKTLDALSPALAMQADHDAVKFLATWAVRLNILLAPALLVSILLNVFFAYQARDVTREYFGYTPGVGLTPMVPLSSPYRSVAEVLDFGQKTLLRSFTLSFSNYRQELEDVRHRYTDAGFATFLDQLDKSGILKMIKEDRINASITASTPVLTASGVVDGFFVWQTVSQVELKLSGQTTERTVRWRATQRIQRVPTQQSIEALGVAQLVTAPIQ